MVLLESQTMADGTPLPSFTLKDVHGKDYDSSTLQQNKLALVIFTCNHCPYAIASWPTLLDLYNKYKKQGLEIIAINPNNNPGYPDDRFETMKPYAEENGIVFPYLFDSDQSVALLYQAVCTPDPFLFLDGKLFYHGRLNDNWQYPDQVKENSMELFIQSALTQSIEPDNRYPSMGCSIKWVNS